MVQLYQWLCLFGVPTIIAGIIKWIANSAKKKAEAIRLQREHDEAEIQILKLGMQALLRDRLKQSYSYYINKGWADFDDRANLENMHTQYEALGKNGVMKHLKEAFEALPMGPQ